MIREHVNQAYNTCMHINMLSLYYIFDLRATQLERQCKGHDDTCKGLGLAVMAGYIVVVCSSI